MLDDAVGKHLLRNEPFLGGVHLLDELVHDLRFLHVLAPPLEREDVAIDTPGVPLFDRRRRVIPTGPFECALCECDREVLPARRGVPTPGEKAHVERDFLDFEHLPERLPNRNQELQTIDTALRRLADGEDGRAVRIYGPSGAGKTTVATFAARGAGAEYGANYATVDCIEHRTRAAVLHNIAQQLGMSTSDHESTPAFAYHEYFRDHVDQAVVVLDEAGQLADTTVMQELWGTDGLTLIVVTHDGERLESRISESLASRLRTGDKVYCGRYSKSELVDILDARLRAGDLRNGVTKDAVELVAEISAGNARDGIATVKEAIQHTSAKDGVRTETVGEVKTRAKEKVIRRYLASMDTEHRVIYQIVTSAGTITAPDLKERVEEQLDISDRQRRRFTKALVYANAIESEGKARGKTFSPVMAVSGSGFGE